MVQISHGKAAWCHLELDSLEMWESLKASPALKNVSLSTLILKPAVRVSLSWEVPSKDCGFVVLDLFKDLLQTLY